MRYITIILLSLMIAACHSFNDMTRIEYDKFTVKNDTIFYLNEPVAVYLNIEWEYYRNHKNVEISVQRINGGIDKMTDDTANFIRKRHPKSKVEVKIPNQWNTQK